MSGAYLYFPYIPYGVDWEKLYLYLSFVLTMIQAVLLTPELAFHYPTLDANDLLRFFDD